MSDNSKSSPEDVAKWMLDQVNEHDYVYQEDIVYKIQHKFGARFAYENENGNPAIDKNVLKAFRKLSGDSVIWERGERLWRQRADYDSPGRQQD